MSVLAMMSTQPFSIDDTLSVSRFQNGLKLSKSQSTTALSLKDCFDLPMSVYLLDLQGKTMKINEIGANICGFGQPEEAQGLSLFDVSTQESAESLIDNCDDVLKQESVKIFDEFNVRNDNTSIYFLSIKHPCYNEQGELFGLLGFSMVPSEHPLAECLDKLSQYQLFIPSAQPDQSHQLQLNIGDRRLTQREQQCLQFTAQGYSAKSIAQELGISNRTVEEYLTNIKMKFNVRTKQALLRKVLS